MYMIQRDANTQEWLKHKGWTADKNQAAKMTETAANRCLLKLRLKGNPNAVIVPA